MSLSSIHARQIFDSRGRPTIEVEIEIENYGKYSAAVPSGASTGLYEAVELRDGNMNLFMGQGLF